jgi:hypothetical protein
MVRSADRRRHVATMAQVWGGASAVKSVEREARNLSSNRQPAIAGEA